VATSLFIYSSDDGPSLASSVVNTTLGFNTFDLNIKRCVSFIAGQPWGGAIMPLGHSSRYNIISWFGMQLSKYILV
jgi:hypothetical protein